VAVSRALPPTAPGRDRLPSHRSSPQDRAKGATLAGPGPMVGTAVTSTVAGAGWQRKMARGVRLRRHRNALVVAHRRHPEPGAARTSPLLTAGCSRPGMLCAGITDNQRLKRQLPASPPNWVGTTAWSPPMAGFSHPHFTPPDTGFSASLGATHLNAPIVGTAVAAHHGGYWLVASAGRAFAHGNANSYRSAAVGARTSRILSGNCIMGNERPPEGIPEVLLHG
jgi:hypothetical protein